MRRAFERHAGEVATSLQEKEVREEALRESEARLRGLIQDLNVGVVLLGREAEVLWSNSAALEMLGLTAPELLGKSVRDPSWDVVREDGSPFPVAEFPAVLALETRRPQRNVVMGVSRPGSARAGLPARERRPPAGPGPERLPGGGHLLRHHGAQAGGGAPAREGRPVPAAGGERRRPDLPHGRHRPLRLREPGGGARPRPLRAASSWAAITWSSCATTIASRPAASTPSRWPRASPSPTASSRPGRGRARSCGWARTCSSSRTARDASASRPWPGTSRSASAPRPTSSASASSSGRSWPTRRWPWPSSTARCVTWRRASAGARTCASGTP